MTPVQLNGNRIKDWPSFFECSAEAFGRPDLAQLSGQGDFGAWIGMLSEAADPRGSDGPAESDEELRIVVEDTERFSERAPEVLARFVWAIGWVNRRHGMAGGRLRVVVLFR